jgi:hypothetical protein
MVRVDPKTPIDIERLYIAEAEISKMRLRKKPFLSSIKNQAGFLIHGGV